MLYLYDDKGKIYGISVNEQIYYFMENIQGDVIGLYDYYGKVCARYTYDPWGNIIGVQELDTVTFGEDNKKIGEVNPFRYRGYYYDAETGFYYLNSRYYDPHVKRFINADTISLVVASPDSPSYDKNLFAYCDNNPIVRADDEGQFWNFVVGAVVGAVVGGVSAALSGGDWKAIALGAGFGAASGLIAASGIPAGFQIAAGGILSGGSNLATQTLIEGKSLQQVDWLDVGLDTAIGTGASILSYGVTKNATQIAENTIDKGISKIVTGKSALENTGRYGRGTIKKGLEIMRSGVKSLNTAQGKSSVIGSFVGGFVTTVKNLFKKLF